MQTNAGEAVLSLIGDATQVGRFGPETFEAQVD